MICHKCEKEVKNAHEVVEETNEGYVWEQVCEHCGHMHTGYEF